MKEPQLIRRHQVAISGRITERQTGRRLPGARVEITRMPTELKNRVAALARIYGINWPQLPKRLDRTETAADGHFHFLDLPNGQYTLTATQSGGRCERTAQAHVRVSRDAKGYLKPEACDIELPA